MLILCMCWKTEIKVLSAFIMKYYGKKRVWLQPNDSVQRPKVSRYGMKFLFCIFWNSSGVLYYELLQKGQTVTADVYCRQLKKFAEKYHSFYGRTTKRCSPILLHDNARPHTTNQSAFLNWILKFFHILLIAPTWRQQIFIYFGPCSIFLRKNFQWYRGGKKLPQWLF